VKTSVVKDGNVFMVHILDPSEVDQEECKEKADTETSEKAGKSARVSQSTCEKE